MQINPLPIQLVVGLGNPGPEYAATRHNAGAWFLEALAAKSLISLRHEKKFHGFYAGFNQAKHPCHLLIPSTYMNRSGQSLRALLDFYKIPAEAILVVQDELDFPPGIARIKFAGGHGGHNGLSDIIHHLNTPNFHRLRLGIGHPGDRAEVSHYVLTRPPLEEEIQIKQAIKNALAIFDDLIQGKIAKATKQLHQL